MTENLEPKGLGPNHNLYTVFAVYEENLQPYATTVLCGSPEEACRIAQVECAYDNDPDGEYPEPERDVVSGNGWVENVGNFGGVTLTAFQVVAGKVKVVL